MTNLDRKLWLVIATSFVRHLRQSDRAQKNRPTEHGFSLIESLVAAVVVVVLLVSIGPMIAVSNAARVNARRVDQAVQAGKSYIEGVRGKVINTSEFPNSLIQPVNAQSQYTFDRPAPTAANFPIPTGCGGSIDGGTVPGVCVDANGNGFSIDDPQDMVIQPMRSGAGKTEDQLRDEGFWLAVRVYRADAFASGVTLKNESECENVSSNQQVFVSTQGSRVCPLVSMRSQIVFTLNLDSIQGGTGKKIVK